MRIGTYVAGGVTVSTARFHTVLVGLTAVVADDLQKTSRRGITYIHPCGPRGDAVMSVMRRVLGRWYAPLTTRGRGSGGCEERRRVAGTA